MKVFEEKVRIDSRPIQPNESIFDFLNRTSYPLFNQIRNKVNSWIETVPDSNKVEFIDGLKHDWESTYFELLLNKLFVSLGFEIEIHPQLSSSTKRPDFKLVNGEEILFAEARLATDKSDQQRAIEGLENQILSGINRNVRSRYAYLSIQNLVIKKNQSVALKSLYKVIKSYIEENKDNLDASNLFNYHERYEDRLIYENEAFKIEITLIPRDFTKDFEPNYRIIAVETGPAQFIDSTTYLKKAIQRKANKYGKLEVPFIICIQIGSDFSAFPQELDDLLFGTGIYQLDYKTIRRDHNGLYGTQKQPKMTKVSGIMFVWGALFKT